MGRFFFPDKQGFLFKKFAVTHPMSRQKNSVANYLLLSPLFPLTPTVISGCRMAYRTSFWMLPQWELSIKLSLSTALLAFRSLPTHKTARKASWANLHGYPCFLMAIIEIWPSDSSWTLLLPRRKSSAAILTTRWKTLLWLLPLPICRYDASQIKIPTIQFHGLWCFTYGD